MFRDQQTLFMFQNKVRNEIQFTASNHLLGDDIQHLEPLVLAIGNENEI